MLKTSKSTWLTKRPRKGGVGVSGNGDDKSNDDTTSLMLRTSLLKDSSTSVTQIVVRYDRVDNSGGSSDDFDKKFYLRLQYDSHTTHLLTSMLKTSSSTDLSMSAIQIVVEFDEIDASSDAIGKSVKKLSKSLKSFKSLKKLQRPSV